MSQWREKASQLDVAKAALFSIKAEVLRNDKITTDLESNLAKARANARKHRQALDGELANSSYDCVIGSAGMQLLRDAAENPR